MNKQNRQSNIELLRLLAMAGVIVLHYNNETMGGGFRYAAGTRNVTVLEILESLFICGVNLFIMISGYFLVRSNRRTVGRALLLLLQVVIYSIIINEIKIHCHELPNNRDVKLNTFLPVNWFVVLYAALYLLSPLLNRAISGLDGAKLTKALILLLVLFSVWPTAVDALEYFFHIRFSGLSTISMTGRERGYSLVHFMLCYLIGASLNRLDLQNLSLGKCRLTRFLLFLLLLINWGTIFAISHYVNRDLAWEYCSPLILLEALLLLLIFLQTDLGSNRAINFLSGSAFSVYLLHPYILKYLKIEEYAAKNIPVMLLHMAVIITGIVLASVIIDKVYHLLLGPAERRIGKIGKIEW